MDLPSVDKTWGWIVTAFGGACAIIWKLFSRRVDKLEESRDTLFIGQSALVAALALSEKNAILYFTSKTTTTEMKDEWRADLALIRADNKDNHKENTTNIAAMNSSIGELRSLMFQVLTEVSKHATK